MQAIKTFANKTSTDLSAKAGYGVEYDTSGIDVGDAITDVPVGIIVRGGETKSDVCILGECQAIAGGTVTAGKHLSLHTDGTVLDSAASGCQDFALALESGLAGDWVQVFVLGVSKTHS